jgi:hypothetical protein
VATLRHEVPTHLNVEDRALFGLSVRQLALLLAGCAAAYAAYDGLPDAAIGPRLALAAVVLLAAAALALVRPGGRGLELWAFALIRYAASPRRRVWRVPEPDPERWLPRPPAWAELSPRLAWREVPT